MAEKKQPRQGEGMENVSVNSSRRSGVIENGTGNPDQRRDSNESTRVPDQQVPIKKPPGRDEAESRPAE